MSEWQDISTAPKDGTIILLAGHDGNLREWTEAGFWQPNGPIGCHSYPWVVFDIDAGTETRPDGPSWGPTYWQPLPSPPKEAP